MNSYKPLAVQTSHDLTKLYEGLSSFTCSVCAVCHLLHPQCYLDDSLLLSTDCRKNWIDRILFLRPESAIQLSHFLLLSDCWPSNPKLDSPWGKLQCVRRVCLRRKQLKMWTFSCKLNGWGTLLLPEALNKGLDAQTMRGNMEKKNVEGCTEKREENNSERGKMSGNGKLWRRHMHRGVVIDGDASGLEEGKRKEKKNTMIEVFWAQIAIQM